jgi:hypothetical protein
MPCFVHIAAIVFPQEGPDLMTMPKSDYHDLLRSTKDLRPVPSAVYAARATAGSPPVSSEADRAGSPGGATDVRCSVPSRVTLVLPLCSVASPIVSVCTRYSLVAAVCRDVLLLLVRMSVVFVDVECMPAVRKGA